MATSRLKTAEMSADDTGRVWTRERIAIAVLLTIAYTAYYLCRTNFSVARPPMIAELVAGGMGADDAKIALGRAVSLGALASALAKLFAGSAVNRLGGKRAILIGLFGAAAATAWMATLSTPSGFAAAWSVNRLFQALGWPSIVWIAASVFPAKVRGAALGVLSLSYLVGDALDRALHGAALGAGLSWRSDFLLAAGLAATVAIGLRFLLQQVGRMTPGESKTPASADRPSSIPVSMFLRDTRFWSVCALCLSLTLIREAFVEWMPTYFVEAVHFSPANAARASALFPLLGGVSAVLFGHLTDHRGARGKAILVGVSLFVSALLLALLGLAPTTPALALLLCAAIGLASAGAWTYLLGAAAIELGGARGAATATGLIDGIGYIGAVLAGEGLARMVAHYGWSGAFIALAVVAVATLPFTLLYARPPKFNGNHQ